MKTPLYLDPSVAACRPSACFKMDRCARRDISSDGRPLADFSIPSGYGLPDCCAPMWRMWIKPGDAVRPDAAPVVRDWIGQ